MKPSKIAPIFREVELSFAAHSSPRVRSRKLAAYALEKISEAKRINGTADRPAPHRQIVDGREGAPLASVKPDGVIVARFNLVTETLIWIGDELMKNSPVLTGQFARSHVLYVDGVPHVPGTPYPDGEEYAFINVQPYARRIEKGWSKKVPDGLYEGVATMAAQRFGNIARIGFAWRSLEGAGALDAWAGKTSMTRKDRDLKGADLQEWLKRQPAITVRPN
ncbi:hypothetical protein [Aureimonas sp. AU12]|uniref:hypothetical protein n=1 Tax=Aureimonas sp. AU12 TaxID=1638161 RepID=UPI000785CB2F|nr:hypothetical protein [Aureimonas sp. AU12]